MPTTSTKRQLRAPLLSEPPNGPVQIGNLVADLEAEVGYPAARSVLITGAAGQTVAGRQLTAADFTDMGLLAPRALWNLSDVSDASGAGLGLTNKGAVPFGVGIEGAAATAAVFAGSTAQALYRDDTGAADPLRTGTGSFGAWIRNAKRGVDQTFLAKGTDTGNQRMFFLNVGSNGTRPGFAVSVDGVSWQTLVGSAEVLDDAWHFVVGTFDGDQSRLFVDGTLDAQGAVSTPGALFGASGPVNIGGYGASAAVAAGAPWYGRVDEAFITSDVLSEDEVRLLYAVKVAHGAGKAPRRAGLGVRRRRRGAPLVPGDFPAAPVRLYNLEQATTGNLPDEGTANVPLASNGTWWAVAGADGRRAGAVQFNGTTGYLAASDAGLPVGTATVTLACWIRTNNRAATNMTALTYGTNANPRRIAVESLGSADTDRGKVVIWDGANATRSAQRIDDGQWHFVVNVNDFSASDGIRTKLYVDGRLSGQNTAMASAAGAGATGLRVGANQSPGEFFLGAIDGVVIYAGALTAAEVAALYRKASQELGLSPKEPGAHVERIDATNIYFIGDTLEPQDTVELEVAA